ncbi:MAG TPA: hypothetical protein VMV86_01330 [Methanosarcinales archaeon]|nr:hypothetical protein [Methanosarcinales archaeon]
MKILLIIYIIIFSARGFADDESKAAEYLAKAALKTDTGKRIENKLKNLAEEYVNKETSAVIVAGTAMAVEGKIDTNKLNYKMKINEKGYIKPYIIYDIKENVTTGMFYMHINY